VVDGDDLVAIAAPRGVLIVPRVLSMDSTALAEAALGLG
jgi:hypothetical protein